MTRLVSALLFLLVQISALWAQELRLHGTVSHDGAPVAGAKVVEMDANHRIFNQTYTDAEGRFTMPATNGKTSLRITAPGMRRFTQKIGTTTQWQVELKADDTPIDGTTAQKKSETKKLLVGHLNGRPIPQLTWVEQLTDTTFTLVIPVRMPSAVEEYPAGRRLNVTDNLGRVVAIGICIESAMPEEGTPESWDPFIRPNNNNSANNQSGFTSNDSDYFSYPRFRFTKAELEYLIDNSQDLACFAVDTARGDNYWMYYPARTFSRSLQKILNKMLK